MTDARQDHEPPDEDSVEQDTPADKQSRVAVPQRSRVRPTTRHTEQHRHNETPPLDFSPASTAVDPSDAKQDLAAGYAIGRFEYTPNATFTNEELPARSDSVETLNQLNRESGDEESDEHDQSRKRAVDLRRDIEGWGEQIGLTDTEVHEAIRIVEATATGVRRNFGLATVCLGALTIAANQPTCGRHTAKSIRLRGPQTDNRALVERYERLRDDLGVTQARISDFRRWYHQNHS